MIETENTMSSIGEISKKYDVSIDTLRYYERIGLLDPITKNSSGHRVYSQEDENRLYFILCMRKSGLSIESLMTYFNLFKEGDETILQRKEILMKQHQVLKEKIDKEMEILKRLEYKIAVYDERIVKAESSLLKD